MRILHTSDWHLGRTLHGVDLIGHQAVFLDHLVETVREQKVDAVLVAGDVYDRAIPPVDAVALLSDALARLAEAADVVLTPGNHDSAIRLGFGAQLMRPGIHVRARLAGIGEPVLVGPRGGTGAGLVVYALPYLDPDAARWALAPRAEAGEGAGARDAGAGGSEPLDVGPLARSHAAVTSAAMDRVGADLAARRAAAGNDPDSRWRAVVMGHAFVVGGAPSESERDIRVGGVDSVPGDVFGGRGLDYVALGHLHGPQAVTVRQMPASVGSPDVPGGEQVLVPARYSGSPLAYSFSEQHHRKSSVIVDLDSGAIELIDCPVPRRLADLVGTLDELLGPAGDAHTQDWLRVTVTDEVRPTDLYARIKSRFPQVLQVTHRPPQRARRETVDLVRPGRDPLEVVVDFVDHVTGTAPTSDEFDVLRDALESAQAAERSA